MESLDSHSAQIDVRVYEQIAEYWVPESSRGRYFSGPYEGSSIRTN